MRSFNLLRGIVAVTAAHTAVLGEVIVNQASGRTGQFIGSQQPAAAPTFTQAAFDDVTFARACELGTLTAYGRGTGTGADNTAVVAAFYSSPDLTGTPALTASGQQIGTDLFFDFGGATLPAGRYWLTAYVVRLNSRGTWQWALRNPIAGGQAVWHNPGGGFAQGTTAIALGNLLEQADLAFILTGNPSASRPPVLPSALINLSTRATLAAGQTLSTGFVIGGAGRRRVLVRAIGPALVGLGVTGFVSTPALTVFSAQSPLASNGGWGGDNATAAIFAAVGAFALPTNSRDAVLVLTLDPGNYTAQVRGENAGDVLVEVYFVD